MPPPTPRPSPDVDHHMAYVHPSPALYDDYIQLLARNWNIAVSSGYRFIRLGHIMEQPVCLLKETDMIHPSPR